MTNNNEQPIQTNQKKPRISIEKDENSQKDAPSVKAPLQSNEPPSKQDPPPTSATVMTQTDNPIPTPNNSSTPVTNTNNTTNGQNQTSRDYYFDSYSHHSIHEEMLKDTVRTQTYRNAILENAILFRNKIVLDVGCGTGILSLFAAQAGAKHVYGIDCSNIIHQAKEIVKRNGYEDNITLIQGKVEDVELPVDQVDIIISEWMGYFLLYESMLDTVLYARDKWLAPTHGKIFPDKAVLYIGAIEDATIKKERIDFWSNVYGFDMSNIADIAMCEPVVDVIAGQQVVSDTKPILQLDLLTCSKDDLSFHSSFQVTTLRDDFVHGLVVYFECAFTQIDKPIGFSTSPFSAYTHWKQTIFYFKDPLTMNMGDLINGTIACRPNPHNNRDLDIEVEIRVDTSDCQVESSMLYHLR